jgi:hypothetical protein
MPSTYFQLTNQLLRQFNEVQFSTEAEFNSAIGVHALAKDCIRNAILDINMLEYEWPFNAKEYTQVLTAGQNEYDFPDDFKYMEWESFIILKDDSLNVTDKKLKILTREEWYSRLRVYDFGAGASGISVPEYVFPSAGSKFGVSPSPDKAYQLKFTYFKQPDLLVDPTDEVTIPSMWDNVIIMKASPRMELFRNNGEGAAASEKLAEDLLNKMRAVLINKQTHVYDGRVNLNRFRFSGGYI